MGEVDLAPKECQLGNGPNTGHPLRSSRPRSGAASKPAAAAISSSSFVRLPARQGCTSGWAAPYNSASAASSSWALRDQCAQARSLNSSMSSGLCVKQLTAAALRCCGSTTLAANGVL